jgi:hypothetical protein
MRALSLASWAIVGFVFQFCGHAQVDTTPFDLVARLAKTPGGDDELFFGVCNGTANDQQYVTAARSLLSLGAAAIPAIERAVDELSKEGSASRFASNANLLLFTYAQLEHGRGYQRESTVLGGSNLAFLQDAVNSSIAVSLGLTAYVSFREWTNIPRGPVAVICGPPEPRYALSQLVLAWEGNNRLAFEATLGPSAKSALQVLLAGRRWEEMREDFWRSLPSRVALGYRFERRQRWSRPLTPLSTTWDTEDEPQHDTSNPEIETSFVSESGRECAKRRVRFVVAGDVPPRYLMDSADVAGLLRDISFCLTTR